MDRLNLAGVQPEARPIVAAASAVYLRHTRPWLIGLVIHGSALKGGFIPWCSDIDLQLYLEDAAFTDQGQLPLELCLAIQGELARIDPAPFHYIQCYALPPSLRGRAPSLSGFGQSRSRWSLARPRLPDDYVGPIPGAYQVLTGSLPVAEATEERLRASAKKALEQLRPPPEHMARDLLQHGGGKLERLVRLVCTDVWPCLYQMLALQVESAIQVWGLPKAQAIGLLAPESEPGQIIRAFYEQVSAYYTVEASVALALQIISSGAAFLSAVKRWWEQEAEK